MLHEDERTDQNEKIDGRMSCVGIYQDSEYQIQESGPAWTAYDEQICIEENSVNPIENDPIGLYWSTEILCNPKSKNKS